MSDSWPVFYIHKGKAFVYSIVIYILKKLIAKNKQIIILMAQVFYICIRKIHFQIKINKFHIKLIQAENLKHTFI